MKYIYDGLVNNKTLENLIITELGKSVSSKFSEGYYKYFSNLILHNSSIKTLSFSNNDDEISKNSIDIISKVLKKNKTITNFDSPTCKF
jgi:hypothetical protein